MKHKTIFENDIKLEQSDREFRYQKKLTDKLDKLDEPFNQNIINEIVLWKVNRFAEIDSETLRLLNEIDTNSEFINKELTVKVLFGLLNTKGIKLPMASTILRFRNSKIYQIIDQRVFRIINSDSNLSLNYYNSENNIKKQIDIYLLYLDKLREVCEKYNIPFEQSDRILYMLDKRVNKDIKLKNH